MPGFDDFRDGLEGEGYPRPPRKKSKPKTEANGATGFSEDDLALIFADRHGDDHRYVAAWAKWLYWIGTHWDEEKTLKVYDLARKICREMKAQCDQKDLGKAKTVAAVETMARSDRRIAAISDQWDTKPLALNTLRGTENLKTGELHPHVREDYHTKITAVGRGNGGCPLWLAFLDRIFDHDQELIDYMQKVCGYCLTGDIREHAMFFCYGTGANGKGVFMSTLAGILGDKYARNANIDTFTVTSFEQHPTSIARLRGARLVTCAEVEQGKRWAESKIKEMTGGGLMTAHFMRQDDFEFFPQFKLMIAGNHKPGLRAVDEAIRRRMHLIPFTVTIPEAERDQELAEKLKAEWPQILQWMIDGCLRWQRDGLQKPPAVAAATEAYLMAEDTILSWIEERCDVGRQERAKFSELFADWKLWAEANNEFAGSAKAFADKLDKHGFEDPNPKNNTTKMRRGLSLQPPEPTYNYADRHG